MTPNATHNFQFPPDEVLDTFAEPICTYVRHLHNIIQQQQERIRQQQQTNDGLEEKLRSPRNKAGKNLGLNRSILGGVFYG